VMIMLGGAAGYAVTRRAPDVDVSGDASRDPYALCVPDA